MAYNRDQHAALGWIDKQYKDMLDELAGIHGRKLKGELEYLIAAAHKKEQRKV